MRMFKWRLLITLCVTTVLVNAQQTSPFKYMLGVNAFEWDFLQDPKIPNDGSHIFEPKMHAIKSYGGIRHYLDWQKIENNRGSYTFNPTQSGGWNLDAVYERCKKDNIDVLVCLKTCPDWLLASYPADQRDNENVPMSFGSDKSLPSSYSSQSKMAFQFAARYGYNKNVDRSLISVNDKPRWTGDPVNKVMVGMGLIKYIECDNERDKWWKGDKAHQTASEYAANLSAFYDGDRGKMGKNAGVKTADRSMNVVMAGLAAPDIKYVADMIDWCKKNRGYKKDGSVNLCFDVINFHLYANDRTAGIAPELSEMSKAADSFVKLGKQYHVDVWVTEAGYDINPKSPQRAISIGSKSAAITQADWIIRTSLLYARHYVKRVFFYELHDNDIQSQTQYASSGLSGRPAENYIKQAQKLIGDYHYQATISHYPIVDVYINGLKKTYVIYLPTQKGDEINYTLTLKNAATAKLFKFNPGSGQMLSEPLKVSNNTVSLKISETPIIVQ